MAIKFKKEVKIGIIGLLTIVLLIWGMNFLKGKNVFSQKHKYFAVYKRIEGLQNTAPILIKGYKIGYVNNIYFNEKNRDEIIVELLIDNEIKLPENTIASIFSADLMGSKAINLLITNATTFYKPGDTINTQVEANLTEQVSVQMLPLKNNAENLMKEMQEALEVIKLIFNEQTRNNLSKSLENISATIQNLNNISRSIDSVLFLGRNNLSEIISNIESITNNLKNSNKEIGAAVNNFSSITDSIAQSNIKSTINNINDVFAQLNDITTKINKGEGSLGALINNDTLYYNLQKTSADLDLLIKDINDNPKKYINISAFGGKNK